MIRLSMQIAARNLFLKALIKNRRILIVCLVTIFLSILTPIWLTIVVIAMVLIFLAIYWCLGRIQPNLPRKMAKGFFFVIFVFSISIIFKILVFDIYRIPGGSMEDALYPGDVIMVNKLIYGPKLPRNPFEISWVNLLFYTNNKARKAMNQDWWPYKRLSGINDLSHGDVLVYQQSRGFFIVKRCVAMAGDTLQINGGEVYINGKYCTLPKTIKEYYRLVISNGKAFYEGVDSLKINERFYPNNKRPDVLEGALSKGQVKQVKDLKTIKTINKVLDSYSNEKGLFAMPEGTQWTLDAMGPFVVPQKGMRIALTPQSFSVYGKTIQDYEGKVLEEKEDGYYDLEGKKIVSYTFSQNFCFLMGDNRKESTDSRYFGFVPESNIVGKVQCILFSHTNSQFRWRRLFKSL